MENKISIGRIVRYVLSEFDVEMINRQRLTSHANCNCNVSVGEVYPLIAVRIWKDEFGAGKDGVNGQVFLDGNDTLWVTSVGEIDPSKGLAPGAWFWPERN